MDDIQTSDLFALSKWQKCHFVFSDDSTETRPAQKADALRGILNQIYHAKATNSIPVESQANLTQHYLKLYSSIVDSCNTETGVNNYAESALELCKNRPNESALWKSSLTQETIGTLKCVQDLVNASQLSAASKQPINSNEIIQLKSTESSDPGKPHLRSGPSSQANLLPSSPSQAHFGPSGPGQAHVGPSGTGQAHVGPSSPGQAHMGPSGLGQAHLGPSNPSHTHAGSTVGMSSISSNDHNVGPINDGPGHVYNVNNQQSSSSSGQHRLGAPLFKKVEQPHQAGFDRRQLGSQKIFRGGAADGGGNVVQRGGYCAAFQGGQINQPSGQRSWNGRSIEDGAPGNQPSGQRSWNGRSSGDGSLFGGPGSMKRKTMSPEGDSNHSSSRHPGRYQADKEDTEPVQPSGAFKTARDQLAINNQKKFGNRGGGGAPTPSSYGTKKKSLGTTRRGLNSKFVPPVMNKDEEENLAGSSYGARPTGKTTSSEDENVDPRLKNIEPKMIELITNEIMDHGPPIEWNDIAGLEFAKTTIKEIVVWPMLRPDIFNGLRGPPKGLLLFGPPGTGKTLIGKCIASQSGATFFSISASSLTSKWVGEGEKMVRALFAVARCNQPAVIFIDEIDSLLSQRSNDEHESSRRIKTEFLVQLDGATTSTDDRLLVVGATNRPQEIDEAARRRLVKRLYIPLPEGPARTQIVMNLLAQQRYSLSEEEIDTICQSTDGYSGADMSNLCREAALGPIRAIGMDIQHISADSVRPILHEDFVIALQNVRPSVTQTDLDIYLDWNKKFGSGGK